MSLADFSNTIKQHIKDGRSGEEFLSNRPDVLLALEQLQDGVDLAFKASGVTPEKEILAQATSLLNEDYVKKGPRGRSEFRIIGQKLDHNISVITEETLSRHWVFYDLKLPKINGQTVVPGTKEYKNTTSKRKGLMHAFVYWYTNMYSSRSKTDLEFFSDIEKQLGFSKDTSGIRFQSTYGNTSAVLLSFLKACGLSKLDVDEYGEKFEIGHIESQAHIRAKMSNAKIGSYLYNKTFIDKIIELHKYLDLASSSLLPKYKALTASVLKDTSDISNIFINVEMQLKDTSDPRAKKLNILEANTNQGSGALSKSLGFYSALTKLVTKTVENTMLSQEHGSDVSKIRQLEIDSEIVMDTLTQMYKNYSANYEKVFNAISASFPKDKNKLANFMLDLKSSKTIRKHLVEVLASSFSGNPKPVAVRVSHRNVGIQDYSKDINTAKALDKKLRAAGDRIKKNLSELAKTKAKPKNTTSRKAGPALSLNVTEGVNLSSLQVLINTHLQDVISANMGNGNDRRVLNYRTGRLAASAKVERLSESREGMITAFYTYMKNPYATFSEGGRQQYPKTRDPKLLIGNAIKEIAATQVGARLRAVVI